MLYTVHAYVNCDRDNFSGLQPAHTLAEDGDLVFEVKGWDAIKAAKELWTVGNRMGCDIHGKEWPSDVRSLSVGDMLKIRPSDTGVEGYSVRIYAIAKFGFDEIAKPINPIVPLAGQGRVTRRPREELLDVDATDTERRSS